jgi:hypothetical protein
MVDKEAVLRPFDVPQPSERSVQGITKPVSQKTDTAQKQPGQVPATQDKPGPRE